MCATGCAGRNAGSRVCTAKDFTNSTDRIAACKTYQGAAYTDASPLQYLDRANESRLVHPQTMKRLRFLLTMLAERGEKETFRFLRRVVLKGEPFAEEQPTP